MAIEGAARRGECPHLYELIVGHQARQLAEREREEAAARSPEAQAEKRADEERRRRQFEEMTRGRIWGAPESVWRADGAAQGGGEGRPSPSGVGMTHPMNPQPSEADRIRRLEACVLDLANAVVQVLGAQVFDRSPNLTQLRADVAQPGSTGPAGVPQAERSCSCPITSSPPSVNDSSAPRSGGAFAPRTRAR